MHRIGSGGISTDTVYGSCPFKLNVAMFTVMIMSMKHFCISLQLDIEKVVGDFPLGVMFIEPRCTAKRLQGEEQCTEG